MPGLGRGTAWDRVTLQTLPPPHCGISPYHLELDTVFLRMTMVRPEAGVQWSGSLPSPSAPGSSSPLDDSSGMRTHILCCVASCWACERGH